MIMPSEHFNFCQTFNINCNLFNNPNKTIGLNTASFTVEHQTRPFTNDSTNLFITLIGRTIWMNQVFEARRWFLSKSLTNHQLWIYRELIWILLNIIRIGLFWKVMDIMEIRVYAIYHRFQHYQEMLSICLLHCTRP